MAWTCSTHGRLKVAYANADLVVGRKEKERMTWKEVGKETAEESSTWRRSKPANMAPIDWQPVTINNGKLL
jgi:hypothetical protein